MKTNKVKKTQETESKKTKKTNKPDLSQTQTPDKTSSGRIWLLVGGGCVLLFFAIVIITVTAVFGYRYLTGGSDTVFYTLQEDDYGDVIDSLVRMESDGSDAVEIIDERDGFYLGMQAPDLGMGSFSHEGDMILLRTGDWGEELILYNIKTATSTYLGEQTLPGQIFEGFSRDDEYFAFTALDEDDEEVTLIVVNQDGDEILTRRDFIFGAFSPTRDQIAVFEIDIRDEVMRGIGLLNLQNDQYTELERLNNEVDDVYQFMTFFSSDGRTLYYRDDDELMSISTSGGQPTSVFRYESYDSGLAFHPPNGRHVIILDSTDYETYDLFALDPRNDDLIKIDNDVYFDFLWGSDNWDDYYYKPIIDFSSDGEYVAYVVGDYGDFDLYVARLDGSERTRLMSSANWIEFTFSPDGEQIAYLEFDDFEEGGDLYIIDIDGSDEIRLDREVWSMQFVPNGRYLVYSKVIDLYSDRPESDVYRIKLNGEDRERIISSEDGIITLIWHP